MLLSLLYLQLFDALNRPISHMTLVCFRPKPASFITSPPGAPAAASVCCYVAAGEAERCDELREAAGVCVHGDRGGPRTDQPQTEGPAHSGSKSAGEKKLCVVLIIFIFMLALIFC